LRTARTFRVGTAATEQIGKKVVLLTLIHKPPEVSKVLPGCFVERKFEEEGSGI
jgi:hypothetical protein